MKKKQFLITAAVLAILAGLVFLQIRHWRKFDWHRFWLATHHTNKAYILGAIGLVYMDYILRAVRWKILLRPVCEAKTSRLIPPTVIGFSGLALLGRPGEFIRPYLISRKENLSMSSQVAVWTVERIFDMGAFAVITALNILWNARTLRQLPGFANSIPKPVGHMEMSSFTIFEISGFALLLLCALAASGAFWIRKNPTAAAVFFQRPFRGISPKIGEAVSRRVYAFGEGLNTVKDFRSFLELSGLSLVIWMVIAFAYLFVTHAYRIRSITAYQRLTLSTVMLLTAASVAGGVLQLPVVGGGSQIATIGVLHGIFGFSPELSTSAGMMLWLVTFMSVIPAGLVFAHFERVSLMKLEKESLAEEEKALEKQRRT